jgi:dolichyl-phosphate-mannose--protein O-mannosyl transferase
MKLRDLFILLAILAFAFFTRFFRLSFPGKMYFDELYHVPAAMLMSDGDFEQPFEWWHQSYDGVNNFDWLHPPLAKYLQAASMKLLGKTAFAWRLPSAIFSLLTLIVFYFFTRFLADNFLFKKDKKLATAFPLLAVLFLSLDGLFLVESRIAMNDVFLLFFMIPAVFLYFYFLREKQVHQKSKKTDIILLVMSVFWGLALAVKWSAIFPLLFLLLYHFFVIEFKEKNFWRRLPFLIFSFLLIPGFVYFSSYLPMFLAGKKLSYFWVLQGQIWQSQLNNPAVHLYSSKPLNWFFNLRSIFYFANSDGSLIYALDNPVLTIYFVLTVLATIWFLWRGKLEKETRKSIFLLLLLYLVNFVFWSFSPRIQFLYHYLPAIPFIVILLTFLILKSLDNLKNSSQKKALLFNFIFWPFLIFLLFYPHWVALKVPQSMQEGLYFFLESWR